MLADLLFEGARYSEAAAEYELAAYSYAQAPEAGRAGYAALVAYDKAEAQPARGGASGAASARHRFVAALRQHVPEATPRRQPS